MTATTTDDALTSATAKVARRITPFLGLLYFVNYLDRTNISFAGPNGMNADLHLSDTEFGLASGISFIGYLLLEVPSNMALHRFGARRWLARIMVTWGIVASLVAFVPNASTLIAFRFLLGFAEAGFFPGVILYLTYWFPQAERARVVALFMVAVPISTAVGSPLSAYVIEHANGLLYVLSGWRAMFLLEGIPAILLGILCWWFLTDRPALAGWLDEPERVALTAQIEADEQDQDAGYHVSIRSSLTSSRIWALAGVYFGIVYGLYALGFFLPTIIAGFQTTFHTSYSLAQRGLINAVPYAIGAVAMLLWSRHGDRTGERVWHVAIPTIVGGVAIPIALYLSGPIAAMVAVSVCAVGVMCALPTFWALPTTFLSGAAAATGLALDNAVGNLAGFVAPYVTGWLADLTGSQRTGLWLVGVAMVAAGVTAVLLRAGPPETAPPPAANIGAQ